MPCSNHFLRQWQIVGLLTPKRSAIAVFGSPLAEASTICARRTRLCRAERDRPMRSSSSRSPSLSVRARSGGRPIRAMIRSVHRRIISEASSFVKLFVGQYTRLDVSLEQTAICVVDENGRTAAQGKVPTDPDAIANWLA